MGWEIKIHTLDVGQGDCSLIQIYAEELIGAQIDAVNILIDGGERDKGAEIIDYLLELNIEKIDLIIITHDDSDHYAGIESMLKKENYWHMCGMVMDVIVTLLIQVVKSDFSAWEEICQNNSFDIIKDWITGQIAIFLQQQMKVPHSLSGRIPLLAESYVRCSLSLLERWCQLNLVGEDMEADWIQFLEMLDGITQEHDPFLTNQLYRNRKDIYCEFGFPRIEEYEYNRIFFKNTVVMINGMSAYTTVQKSYFTGERLGAKVTLDPAREQNPFPYEIDRQLITLTPQDIGKDLLAMDGILPDGMGISAKLVLAAVDGKAGPGDREIITGDRNSKNCNSIAVLLSCGEYLFYTGGDLPAPGEDKIVNNLRAGAYGLPLGRIKYFGFKAGHHGSKTATGNGILSINPLYAVISCGDNLSKSDKDFDHPSPETIYRLNACQSLQKFFSTACAHPIKDFDKKGIVSGYRKTTSINIGGREKLVLVEDKDNRSGNMCCSILASSGQVSSITMFLYEGEEQYCSFMAYRLYVSTKRNVSETAPLYHSFVLIPGLLELENVEWKEEQGVKQFHMDYVIGRLPMELSCFWLETFGWIECSLRVKGQGELTLADILSWLAKVFPCMNTASAFFEKMEMSLLTFTGINVRVDAAEKKLHFLELYGNAHLGGLGFALRFSIPDYSLHAVLLENQHPSLETWLEKAGVSKESLSFLKNVQITHMELTADFSIKSYSFTFALDFGAPLGDFGFEEFDISFAYGQTGGIRISADALFRLGDFSLRIMGGYGNEVWSLQGELMEQAGSCAFSLKSIPVAGQYLPDGMDVEINSAVLGYSNGCFLEVCVDVCGESHVFRLEQNRQENGRAMTDTVAREDVAGTSGFGKRFALQKQLGPVELYALRIDLMPGQFLITPELSIHLGAFTVALTDVSVGIGLADKKPFFALNGMGVSYEAAQFAIAGQFRRTIKEQMEYQYDGAVAIRAAKWQFLGIGSYGRTTDGLVSLYFFADVSMRLALQPSFVLTDIMGGAGIHKKMKSPKLSDVRTFPLLHGSREPLAVLSALDSQWLTVSPQDDWFAVGIGFEVAGLFQGKALLLANLGPDLEFDILGQGSLELPKEGTKKYLHLDIDLLSQLKPKEGVFSVQIAISPESYLLMEDCHITGGIAFFIWFGSHPNKGDFVITAGGYHPAFSVPEHYPKVEPVAIGWHSGSHISLSGSAYMALTPSCAMAGGNLEFQYVDGNLKAWFHAFANLLVAWKPFYFLADIGVELGVSYKLNLLFCHKTISVAIGGSLSLWGPPTGGSVTVHLWFISFTVNFGADKGSLPISPLGWDEFCKLLPESDILNVEPADGLIEQTDSTWVVRGSQFCFSVSSLIPASHVIFGKSVSANMDAGIHIRPMGLSGVESRLSVKIAKVDVAEDEEGERNAEIYFTSTQNYEAVSAALWGQPLKKDGHFVQNENMPSADLVENQIQGADFAVREGVRGDILYIPDLESISVINAAEAKAVSLTLFDYCLPSLKAGRYRIMLEQEVIHGGRAVGSIPMKEQMVSVDSGSPCIPNGAAVSCFPVAGSIGAFENALPYLVVQDGTFPWEREYGNDERTPWVALLVFAEGELPEENGGGQTGTLSVPKKLYDNIKPSWQELQLLCHGRQEGTSQDEYAVVMANRFAQPGRNTVHLVSLTDIRQTQTEQGEEMAELTSLYSFRFECRQQEDSGDFYRAAHRLKLANPEYQTLGADYGKDGYIELAYHGRQDTVSYRGPLIPAGSADTDEPWVLESARQAGRFAALSDTAYLHELMNYRQKGTEQILESPPLQQAWEQLEQNRESLFQSVSREEWEKKCASATGNMSGADVKWQELRRRREDRPFFHREAWEKKILQESGRLETWLSDFRLLKYIPYGYLLPVKELLPEESVRFFRLDRAWMRAAVSGALEIGQTCSRQRELTQRLLGCWDTQIDAVQQYGVLIRSSLMTGWGQSAIYLFDKDGRELKISRRDMLAGDICLLLCEGEAASVRIREPAEGIRMQVNEDMTVSPRLVDTLMPCGRTYQNDSRWQWYRQGAPGVLNICRENGLAQMFQEAVGDEMTPSRFALQFLEGARSVWIGKG